MTKRRSVLTHPAHFFFFCFLYLCYSSDQFLSSMAFSSFFLGSQFERKIFRPKPTAGPMRMPMQFPGLQAQLP